MYFQKQRERLENIQPYYDTEKWVRIILCAFERMDIILLFMNTIMPAYKVGGGALLSDEGLDWFENRKLAFP